MAEKVTYETQYDKMTKKPVGSLIIELGIPTTISMLVTSIYNLGDTFFVGQLKSTSSSAAVGVVFSFMAILQAFGFMFGQGAGSNISRQLGRKDTESASRYASTSFFMAFGLGLLVVVLGYLFKPALIYLLGSSDTIYPYADDYLTFLMWASPFVMTSFVLNNILRFEGKASLAMIGLLTGAILNIILDPVLMFGFHMKIAGAALATSLSQTISFGILLFMFLSGRTQSKLALKNFTHDIRDIWEIVATGFPSLVRQGLGSVATMILNHQAKMYGDAAVAAMTIVTRVGMLIFSAGLGIGQGFQPVCGFNYGAKQYKRVKDAIFFTLKVAVGMIGVFATAGLIFSGSLVQIFRDDPDVIAIGTVALRFQCISLYVIPVQVITNMTLQSTGQKWQATFTSMLRSGIYFIPVLLIFNWLFKLTGLEMAQMVADLLAVVTCIPVLMHFIKGLDEKQKAVDAEREQTV